MKIGDKIPNLTLKNSEGVDITLHSLAETGKALILFFPLSFSNVCTEEMCTVRDNMKLYNSLNANVSAISVDSFFTLREFKKQNNLNFALLSDFNKEATKAFNVLDDNYFGMKGVSKRSAFVINQEKEIVYAETLEDSSKQPAFRDIYKVLMN